MVLAGFVGLVCHMSILVDSYCHYEYTESTREKRDGFNFPDVTVCNTNGISHSNLKELANYDTGVRTMLQTFGDKNNKTIIPSNVRALVNSFEDIAYSVGHKQHDFILKCKFQSVQCKEDDFIVFKYPPYLSCFTFVRGRSVKTTRNGFQSALSMILCLEPEDPAIIQHYNDNFLHTNVEGIRLLLTPPSYGICRT